MAQNIMQDLYKPYFEAVKKILQGTPVDELDDIRQQCNKAYLTESATEVPEKAGKNYPSGYSPLDLVVSFAADAENRILKGADPIEAYNGLLGLEPVEFRQRCRTILENEVQYHF